MDWHSRYVLAWRLSNTLDAEFCVAALEEALSLGLGQPEIFNTDQGSQFTSAAFTDLLEGQDIRVSMDGKGRCTENIFVERLWRNVKYEEVYLKAYQDGMEARAGLRWYFQFYNQERPHQSLDYQTPRQVFEAGLRVVSFLKCHPERSEGSGVAGGSPAPDASSLCSSELVKKSPDLA